MTNALDQSLIGVRFRTGAPAKVNLALRVVGRRADGYHLLHMVNVCTSLADEVELVLLQSPEICLEIEGIRVGVRGDDLSSPENNLATNAFRRFRESFAIELGASILIRKRIPIGGGLGGGSSDAAAVLRILAEIFSVSLEDLRLGAVALSLGADVPYLLRAQPTIVEGIGERLTPLSELDLEGREGIIVVPPFASDTGRIFAQYASMRLPCSVPPSVIPASWDDLVALVRNDLEEASCPAMRSLLGELRKESAFSVGMTGSGSCVFITSKVLKTFPEHDRIRLEERIGALGCSFVPVTMVSAPPKVTVVI